MICSKKTNSWTLYSTKKPQICSFCVALILRYFILKIYTLMLMSLSIFVFFQKKMKRENLNFDQFNFGLHGGPAPLSIFGDLTINNLLYTESTILAFFVEAHVNPHHLFQSLPGWINNSMNMFYSDLEIVQSHNPLDQR